MTNFSTVSASGITLPEQKLEVVSEVTYKRYLGNKEIASDGFTPECALASCWPDKIVAIVDGVKYLVSAKESEFENIIFQEDFDNDGYQDALISSAMGGNCCAPSYSIISYRGEKRFETYEIESWSASSPEIVQDGNEWLFRFENSSFGFGNTDLKNEIVEVRIKNGRLEVAKMGRKVLPFSIKKFTSEEALSKETGSNETFSWEFDFDKDYKKEVLTCDLWLRWGLLTHCHLIDGETVYALTTKNETSAPFSQCKVISVLEDLENSYHRLFCDFDPIIYSRLKR